MNAIDGAPRRRDDRTGGAARRHRASRHRQPRRPLRGAARRDSAATGASPSGCRADRGAPRRGARRARSAGRGAAAAAACRERRRRSTWPTLVRAHRRRRWRRWARGADGGLADLYAGDAGDKLAEFLRGLVASTAPFAFAPDEWPDDPRRADRARKWSSRRRAPTAASPSGARWKRACRASTRWSSAG